MSARGGPAQARRRERRAAARTTTIEVTGETITPAPTTLTAAASGSTTLPLSDRDTTWDAGAARKSLKPEQFADAHFWRDPAKPADQIGSYKLPFAQVVNGKLTAVWRGVTAGAARVDGTDIPDADRKAVQDKMSVYYDKAEKQFNDPSIEPPWETPAEEKKENESADADELEAFDLPDGEGDGPAEPYSGKCAICSDMADSHAGDMNAGACSVEGCDCAGFKPGAVTASTGLTLNFTGLDGHVVPVPTDGTPIVYNGFTISATAAGATSPDIPVEHQPVETLPGEGDAKPDAPADDAGMRWTATLAPEGSPTDDGRIFAPGAITWRELPLSLGVMLDTPHADLVTSSPVCGRIDRIYRQGNTIFAEGVFDNSDLGREIARMVNDGTLRGVSVDVAVSKMEIAYRNDILTDDNQWKGGDEPADDGPDMLDILFGETEDEVMFVIWAGTIGAVTICPFPAFSESRIEPATSLVAAANPLVWTVTGQHGMIVVSTPAEALVASAVETEPVEKTESRFPVHPPREWFYDPEFTELTALQVTDDGCIFGHAAAWGVCHIGIPGVCTTAPQSQSGYAYFHLKEVECDDGEMVSVGTITLDTGHADRRLGRVATAAHYDDTGSAVADIVCGEDDFGIWFSGAVRPDVDDQTLRKLRGAVLSGDWRDVNGHLEFVALLAVNVPGFPVPRTRAMIASAADGEPHVLALVAAGIHAGQDVIAMAERAKLEALNDIASGAYADLAARAQEAAG